MSVGYFKPFFYKKPATKSVLLMCFLLTGFGLFDQYTLSVAAADETDSHRGLKRCKRCAVQIR
jgi:hypothetical protein